MHSPRPAGSHGGSHGGGEWLCCRGTPDSRSLAAPAMAERAKEGLPGSRRPGKSRHGLPALRQCAASQRHAKWSPAAVTDRAQKQENGGWQGGWGGVVCTWGQPGKNPEGGYCPGRCFRLGWAGACRVCWEWGAWRKGTHHRRGALFITAVTIATAIMPCVSFQYLLSNLPKSNPTLRAYK